MATPDPVTALIHFIGIITFTTKLSTDNHLQAILPRIETASTHAEATALHRPTSPRPRPTRHGDANHIETHAAFIAFPACNYISSSGWAPSALETVPGLLFVRLNGEQVAFTPKTKAGRDVERAEETAEQPAAELQLPHLQKSCCKAMTELNSQFQPPYFPGAAAVFDLRYGKANACRAKSAYSDDTRVDTRLTIDNQGGITITATLGDVKKKIELAGNATIYVGNLPQDVLDSSLTTGISAPHYMAYYSMSDGTKGCTTFNCKPEYVPPCSTESEFRMTSGATIVAANGPRGQSLPEIARIDFECSNTQWP